MGKKLWLCACAIAIAAIAGASATSAGAALTCPAQTMTKPFAPWLDFGNYTLVGNGSLESSGGWTLAGGATIVAGNEPWRVHAATDVRSLSLPSGSSATSPPLCVTLLHPTLRFFATNSGSPLATLKVEAITTVLGVRTATPIGVLAAGGMWAPTLPLAFLANLVSPVTGTVSFRFTPIGSSSGWRIDDVYVDPFRQR